MHSPRARATVGPAMDELSELGAAIRCWRAEREWSQAKLAETSGVSQQQVSKWESGRGVDVRELLSLLRALGKGLADIAVRAGGAASPEPKDERVERINRVALEIGLAALAKVAEQEPVALVQAGLEARSPSTRGGAE